MSMDHQYAQKHHFPERYLQGKLPAEERIQFEEHYFDCEECLRYVKLGERFREGLKDVVLEDGREKRRDALDERHKKRWWALAAGVAAVLILLPGAWFFGRTFNGRSEKEQARILVDTQHRLASLEKENAELRQYVNDLPQTTVSVHQLNIVRGGKENTPVISRSGAAFTIFLLDQEPDPSYRDYHMSVQNSQHHLIWSQAHVTPGGSLGFPVAVRSNLLPPDSYSIGLDGVSRDGRAFRMATYRFRISDTRK